MNVVIEIFDSCLGIVLWECRPPGKKETKHPGVISDTCYFLFYMLSEKNTACCPRNFRQQFEPGLGIVLWGRRPPERREQHIRAIYCSDKGNEYEERVIFLWDYVSSLFYFWKQFSENIFTWKQGVFVVVLNFLFTRLPPPRNVYLGAGWSKWKIEIFQLRMFHPCLFGHQLSHFSICIRLRYAGILNLRVRQSLSCFFVTHTREHIAFHDTNNCNSFTPEWERDSNPQLPTCFYLAG